MYLYRKYKSINDDVLQADLWGSPLVLDPPDDVDHLLDLYNSTLWDSLDEHVSFRTKEMPMRQLHL